MLFTSKKPDETSPSPAPKREPPVPAGQSPASPQRALLASAPPAPCIIDAGLVITGNLESDRDVQLDGEVHGDIRCLQLIINRNGSLLGNVVANEVVVRGKVKGIIRADQVMLQHTARVDSEIFHKSLVIEQGATFDGEAYRTDKETATAGQEAQLDELKAMSTDMKAADRRGNDTEAAAA